jgi:hypothetical protein
MTMLNRHLDREVHGPVEGSWVMVTLPPCGVRPPRFVTTTSSAVTNEGGRGRRTSTHGDRQGADMNMARHGGQKRRGHDPAGGTAGPLAKIRRVSPR